MTKLNFTVIFSLFFITQYVYCGGLKSIGEVHIKGVKVGQTYSIKDVFNTTLKFFYGGSDQIGKVKIVIQSPTHEDCLKGFEPIPDISWIKLDKDEFIMQPNTWGEADVIISIPDEEKYMGKKYQAFFLIREIPPLPEMIETGIGLGIGVAVRPKLLLEIAPNPATEEEKKMLMQKKIKTVANFELSPAVVFVDNLEVGRKVDIVKEENIKIRIINTTDDNIKLQISSVKFTDAVSHQPLEGYEPGEPEFLIIDKKNIKIKPDSIYIIPLKIFIPDEKKYKEKKLVFLLKVETIGPVKLVYTSEIYVTTR